MHRSVFPAGVVMLATSLGPLWAGPPDQPTTLGSMPRAPAPNINVPPPRLPSTSVNLPSGLPGGRGDPCGCIYPWPVVHYYYPVPYFYQPIYQPVYLGPTFIDPNGRQPAERVPPPKAKKADEEKPAVPPAAKQKDELEKRADAQRLIRQGNEFFAEGHYLQAAKRYEQAAAAGPFEPMPYFHLAQAQLAQGKYAEAVLAIQRGMRIKPNWPEAPFQPKALYGERGGEYQQHLAHLADVVGKNMNDDSLLFLLGYQLWFDERRDEAMVLFQRAALLAFDTTFVDRFIKALKLPVADARQ